MPTARYVRVVGRRRLQPAWLRAKALGYATPELTRRVNDEANRRGLTPVTVAHVHGVLRSTSRLNETDRVALPIVLGQPLPVLFEAELLEKDWSGTRGRNGGRPRSVQP